MRRAKVMSSRRRRVILTIEVLVALAIGIGAVIWFLRPDADKRRYLKRQAAAQSFKDGDYEQSALHYRALLKDSPQNLEIHRRLWACLVQLNRLNEAEDLAERAVELDPAYAPAHQLLSDLAWIRGEVPWAIREARLASEGKGVAKSARLRLADRLIAAGQTTEGVEVLVAEVEAGRGGSEALRKLAPWVSHDGPKTAAFVGAERHLSMTWEDARKSFEEDPDSPELLKKFAALSLMAGKDLPAVDALDAAAERRDLDAAEVMLLVRALAGAGEMDRARTLLDEMGGGAIEDRAEALLLVGAPGKALSLIDDAGATDDQDPQFRRLELRALLQHARTSGGASDEDRVSLRIVDCASAILAIYPGDEAALAARVPALITRGRLREALADALTLRRVAPENPAGAWLQGLVLMVSGRPASARLLLMEEAASGFSLDPRWRAEASIRVGDGAAALRELGGRDGATALRVAALALMGETASAESLAEAVEFGTAPLRERLLAAKLLARKGRPALARKLISELEALSASMGPLLEVGDLHSVLGEAEEARRAFEAAASPDCPVALAALGRLAEGILASESPDQEALSGLIERMRSIAGGTRAALILTGRTRLAEDRADEALALADQVLTEDPGEPEALMLKFSALAALSRPVEEIAPVADAVLEILPGYGPARVFRAHRLVDKAKADLARGGIDEASTSLDAAVDLIPGTSEALFLRGVLSVSTGETSAAEEDARLLIESPGGTAPGNYLRGLLLMNEGKVKEAVVSFRTSLSADPESSAAAAGLAGALLAADDPQGALDLTTGWLDRDPESIWAIRVNAFALAALGRAVEGAQVLRARAGDDAALLPLRMMAGWLLLRSGKPAEAADDFSAVVTGQPLNARARALQLEACIAAGDREGAARVTVAALARDDLGAVGVLLRARLRSAEGNEDGARNDLAQAVVLAPEDPVARQLLGDALAIAGDVDGARLHLEKAAVLLPGAAQPRLTLALIATEQDRIRDAIALYEEVLRLQPDNALAANNLAHHLTGSPAATPDRPVELARLAVSIAPEFAAFRDTLAMALAAAGSFEEACAESDRALALEGDNLNICVNAVRIHRDAGDLERAREIAKQAEAAATGEKKEDLRRRIEELKLYPDEEEPDDGEK